MSLKWLSADQCDEALGEFNKLVDDTSDRIENFYNDLCTGGRITIKSYGMSSKLCLSYPMVIERGFSVNNDIATANMKGESIVAYQKVYGGVNQRQCSVHELLVNPLNLDSCRHARSWFQIYLDKTKKSETD